MTKGFDCATRLTANTAAAFAADGDIFVCRYLVPTTSWKALTLVEAEIISVAGLQIVSVFETSANRPLSGAAAGKLDGATALDLAYKMGQPIGSTIYTAVDFEPTAAQMALVIAYVKAFNEVTPDYSTGVYGCYAVIEAVRAAGACTRFWQTYAWSRGKVAEEIHIYQYENDVTVNGVGIDRNASFGDEGWWNTLDPVEEVKEYMMSPEDANKVIKYLKATYEVIDDPEANIECRRLANELRKVSGQPEE